MQVTMTLTEESNIDFATTTIKDKSKVITKSFDWSADIDVFDLSDKTIKRVKVQEVSLYEHRLIWYGKRYVILHGLSCEADSPILDKAALEAARSFAQQFVDHYSKEFIHVEPIGPPIESSNIDGWILRHDGGKGYQIVVGGQIPKGLFQIHIGDKVSENIPCSATRNQMQAAYDELCERVESDLADTCQIYSPDADGNMIPQGPPMKCKVTFKGYGLTPELTTYEEIKAALDDPALD